MKTKVFLFLSAVIFSISLLAAPKPLVVLPQKDQGKKVVVVNSTEYKELLKDNKTLLIQLETEKKNWELYAREVLRQKEVNEENNNKLINDYNKLTAELNKAKQNLLSKELTIWKLRGIVGLMLIGIAVAVWLRMKGIL